jgi:hypothetical protein
MGRDLILPNVPLLSLSPLLTQLAVEGVPLTIAMIDGALVPPRCEPPPKWREVRLRSAHGMLTLLRSTDGIILRIFGNADAPLVEIAERLATALRDSSE